MRLSQTRLIQSFFLGFWASAVLFFVPTVTHADQWQKDPQFNAAKEINAAKEEKQCTCFCGTKDGAEQVGAAKITPEKCESDCKAQGDKMVVCAKTVRQFPGNNALCFDKQACDAQKGVLSAQQPPECSSGMKYCFPTPDKSTLKLSTKIGDLETVGDLGVYISGVYKWMVGIAGFFAIIMVMIGGFQYVLGGAASDQIKKGTDRMKNGVIGMVLLFCVVLILQTINPQLLKLEVPRPSKLREINFASNSCEKLLAQDYKIVPEEGSKAECGGTAVIKSGPGGKKVADGLTCAYTKCAKGACISMGTNQPGICAECRYVSKDNPNSPGRPSSQICFGMAIVNEKEYTNPFTQKKYSAISTANYCDFQSGGVLNTSQGNSIIGGLDADGCFETAIDCSLIKSCDDYDDKVTVYYFDDNTLKSDELDNIYPVQLGNVCTLDPCGARYLENKEKCEWNGNDACD